MSNTEEVTALVSKTVGELSMKDWMLARTRMDMNRDEIMNDELALMVLVVWKFKSGKGPELESYMEMGQYDLLKTLGIDPDEVTDEDNEE